MNELLTLIDEMTSPDKMTLREALEFLEELSSWVDMRIEAITDDLKAKGD